MEYSKQLLSMEPDNPDYQLELCLAYSNLGTIAIERDPQNALGYFQQSLGLNQTLVNAAPDDLYFKDELGNGYSWLGATELVLGHLEESAAAYLSAFEVQSHVRSVWQSPEYGLRRRFDRARQRSRHSRRR